MTTNIISVCFMYVLDIYKTKRIYLYKFKYSDFFIFENVHLIWNNF